MELGENWLETKTGKIKVWEAVDPGFMAGERLKLGGGIGGCGGEREAAMVTVTSHTRRPTLVAFFDRK